MLYARERVFVLHQASVLLQKSTPTEAGAESGAGAQTLNYLVASGGSGSGSDAPVPGGPAAVALAALGLSTATLLPPRLRTKVSSCRDLRNLNFMKM